MVPAPTSTPRWEGLPLMDRTSVKFLAQLSVCDPSGEAMEKAEAGVSSLQVTCPRHFKDRSMSVLIPLSEPPDASVLLAPSCWLFTTQKQTN